MVVIDRTGKVTFTESEWQQYQPLLSAHYTARELRRQQFVSWMVEKEKLLS
jgi:hypothetical protein